MNQTNKKKSSDKNEALKIKSALDKVFDTAEKELRELLVEARELAKSLQRKNEQTDKI